MKSSGTIVAPIRLPSGSSLPALRELPLSQRAHPPRAHVKRSAPSVQEPPVDEDQSLHCDMRACFGSSRSNVECFHDGAQA